MGGPRRPGYADVVSNEQQPGADAREAFAELGRISLDQHSLEAVMGKVAELTKRVVPGASEASVTIVERGEPRTIACTGELAVDLDERQYERGYGPCLDGSASGTVVGISDMRTDSRWPDYTRVAAERGALSSLTVPVPLQREVSAALNIYSTDAHAFDDDESRELAATFAAYAGVALANMHLYEAQGRVAEQLQTAMQSRAVIEQAKGILMGSRRCTAEEAFDLLVELSQKSNRKLRAVAESLVQEASTGS